MTLEEAMKLRVGDMVVYHDKGPDIEPGFTYFTEVVDGKVRAADLGLVVELKPDEVLIDWFEESRDFARHDINVNSGVGWKDIEKV